MSLPPTNAERGVVMTPLPFVAPPPLPPNSWSSVPSALKRASMNWVVRAPVRPTLDRSPPPKISRPSALMSMSLARYPSLAGL